MVNLQNLLSLAKISRSGADEMKRLTGLFVAWLLAGFLTYPAVAGPGDAEGSTPQIAGIAIKDGVMELSVNFAQSFDWESVKFVSIKTFANDPPWFPPTRHELTFGHHEVGMMEWYQFDYIEIGNYEVTEEFTVEAKLFGRKQIEGVFDPSTNLLKFDGLDYEPMMKTPTVTVKASTDLKSWKKVSRLEEVDKEYQWGQSMAVRFKFKSAEQQFFIIQVDED
jgi:hypothetical protein|tara:strand:- start:11 stop:676 length:666 start_codon:yes stop_codon:yes gene_type:complete